MYKQGLRVISINALRASTRVARPMLVVPSARSLYISAAATTRSSHAQLQKRWYTPLTVDTPAKDYDYEMVKKIAKGGEPETVLIDVREPHEYKEGHIPTAVNVPVNSSPGALGLDAEDFLDAFGFEKPSTDKQLVFYCLAGVRSANAESLAATYGYQNRGNYHGSYQDWVEHESKQ